MKAINGATDVGFSFPYDWPDQCKLKFTEWLVVRIEIGTNPLKKSGTRKLKRLFSGFPFLLWSELAGPFFLDLFLLCPGVFKLAGNAMASGP